MTVSQFSRDELVALLGADPARITVIPGGVDERFTPDAEPARRERPYVITVASRTARKNLAALQPAAERLRRQGIDLVAVGGDRPQFRAEAARSEAAPGARSGPADAAAPGAFGLVWLGHVDDAALPGLYAGAEAFVLPSHYEGFGLTVLEAMACGTPVVASNAAALPELVGDAGLLVDPDDPTAIADAVERALGDAGLASAARTRARRYSWDRTAHDVHRLLTGLRRPDRP